MSLLKITVLSLAIAIAIVCGLRTIEQPPPSPSYHTQRGALGDSRCGNPNEVPPCWGHSYTPTREHPWQSE